jgi:enamine deaminase RidA (YjgF/YER057c/UK114 family)
MIIRIPGSVATRSRAVIANGIVNAVAVSPIDRSLADAGTNNSRVLTATVYIADMSRKEEMNRAWDEWVARDNPPMRACIGVTLEGQDLVEILVTAALPNA